MLDRVLPILKRAERETEADLMAWLNRQAGDDRFTPHQYRAAILKLRRAQATIAGLRPAMAKGLDIGAQRAGVLSTEHLEREVKRLAAHFGGDLPKLDIAEVVARADVDARVWKRHPKSAARYAGDVGQRVAAELAVAHARGLTHGQAAKHLERHMPEVFAQAGRRAELVALTEGMHAYNQHHVAAVAQLEAEDPGWVVRWDAALDLRVCPLCRRMHGQLAAAVAAPEWDDPGGGKVGPPPRHPRCRCVATAERIEWRGGPRLQPATAQAAPPKPRAPRKPRAPKLVAVPMPPVVPPKPSLRVPVAPQTLAPDALGRAVIHAPKEEVQVTAAKLTDAMKGRTIGEKAQAEIRAGLNEVVSQYGMARRDEFRSERVLFKPNSRMAGAAGSYYPSTGEMHLRSELRLPAKDFWKGVADNKWEPGQAPDEMAKAAKTMVHETIHGHSPRLPGTTAGGAGTVTEEVTTEVAARRIMRDLGASSRVAGYAEPVEQPYTWRPYDMYIRPMTQSIADIKGISYDQASKLVEESSFALHAQNGTPASSGEEHLHNWGKLMGLDEAQRNRLQETAVGLTRPRYRR